MRNGTILAHSREAQWKWDMMRDPDDDDRPAPLTGAALETAIMGLALSHPEYVRIVGAPA